MLPTPLVRARNLERALGSPPIYVKRDDLTGFTFAGSKARQLEFIVADALARRCDVLVTGGGPGSNHCAATAAAAQVAGLDCLLLIYGEESADGHPNLALAHSFGADLRFTNDPDRCSVDRALPEVVGDLGAAGRRPYPVPRGGATVLGAVGYSAAGRELATQLDRMGAEPSIVVVATGSCGTQAGLVSAVAANGYGWRVVGASVSRPVDECRRHVLDLGRGCAGVLGTAEPTARHVEVLDARGPGFGIASAQGAEAARLAVRTEGLLLDPVYTAKAFAALLELVTAGVRGPSVFIHTGGLPAALWQWRSKERDHA